jgi:uncharacterized tellurite resistance protein B-like protein
MPSLLQFLGLDDKRAESREPGVEAITAELGTLEPARAQFFAAFACVLARVAGADLRIDASEVEAMESTLVETAGVSTQEAGLVVRIANAHMEELGGTENFLVTREFRKLSSQAERGQLLHCLFAVAAADDLISGDESNEIMNIAQELGLSKEEALGIRIRFRDKLGEFRKLAGEARRGA